MYIPYVWYHHIVKPLCKISVDGYTVTKTYAIHIMEISVVLQKTSFVTPEEKTIHGVTLGNGTKVWNIEPTFEIGDVVIVTATKYKKDGAWKTTHSLAKVKIG